MGLGGCYTCIKYLMFTFNLLFWILGCAILGVGIWVLVDPNFATYTALPDAIQIDVAAYLFIAVGSFIMLVGFLGCCGAIRESQCMLAMFFVLLSLLFVVLLAAGIYAAVNRGGLEKNVADVLQKTIDNAKAGDKDADEAMLTLQQNLECCGANGPTDWDAQLVTKCPLQLASATGCKDKLFMQLDANLTIVIGVAIGIGVIMLFGMVFSMMMCCAIRDTKA